jgi:hypothetical protein
MSAEERQSEVVGPGELVDKGFATHELPVIDIIEAVAAAKDFMERIGDEPLVNLRLEEIEHGEDEDVWLVTLGYDRVVQSPMRALGINATETRRVYKTIVVDDTRGVPLAMRIRTP